MANYYVRYGGKRGKRFQFRVSDDLVAARTKNSRSLESALRSQLGARLVGECSCVAEFPEAGVSVLRLPVGARTRARRDAMRATLKKEQLIRFAGRTLVEKDSGRPVLYTENFFVKFEDDCSSRKCKSVLKAHGLTVKSTPKYAANAYFVCAPEGTGLKVFGIAAALLEEESVELCHPELIREVRLRTAFPQQWHLKKTTVNGTVVNQHANIEAAWPLSDGQGATIAVIDTGIDIDHDEFRSSGKIVSPRDVTRRTNDPRPRSSSENHGTACAGVACADGLHGASGVAPKARLLPIRLVSGLGSQPEADAFEWAADHGADVISCSWGPSDGDWWDPNDPRHNQFVALPDSTRLAIDYAITNGRNGKGCVICWAAGNGNESVENDGYASYDKVISIAACSDRGKKSVYSDFGASNWCSFPSSNFGPPAPLTPGIWTSDQSGVAGYNSSGENGDAAGDYTESFGGTSSACPGAAGVAALVLARNPELRWDEVKDVLKRCCDKVDGPGGAYDADGHSDKYGYGRLNGLKAIELATPLAASYTAIHTAIQTVPVKDHKTSIIVAHVADTKAIKKTSVTVAIEHTYIEDLIVKVVPPATTGVGPIILHDRSGGSADNLNRSYNATTTPDLAQLVGKSPAGQWKLQVSDNATQDKGNILRFAIELEL